MPGGWEQAQVEFFAGFAPVTQMRFLFDGQNLAKFEQ